MLASPLLVTWRNRVRLNPLARWIYQRWMASHEYEDRFGKRLLAAVDHTAIVWDIGANVGLYTAQFLAHGARQIVCFEPAPEAVRALETKFAAEPRVRICPVALADADGTAALVAAGAAPTNRLGSPGPGTPVAAAAAPTYATVDVPVRRGDALAAELGLQTPNVVKIDVEGYEWEVLKGLAGLLARPELRAVFVEVHFSILHERGLDRAPPQIVALLENAGFAVQWLDLSHLEAARA